MHAQNAYLPLLAPLRSGQLDMSPITPKVFSLPGKCERPRSRLDSARSLTSSVMLDTKRSANGARSVSACQHFG